MPKSRITKKEEKKSLNIKIPEDLYNRLQRARNTARSQDAIYNVSQAVEEFLRRDVARVEKELGMAEQGSHDRQDGLFDNENKVENKAPDSGANT